MSVYILIPFLPFLAFLIISLGGRRLGEASHRIGIPAVVLSFGLSVAAFVEILRNGPQFISLYRLLRSGSLVVDLSLYVDQLSVLLLLLVTGMSAVIHVYSSRYMIGDPRYSRFFAIIALFTFAMVMMVMSNNLLMTYVFWEIMGICSYFLISHWSHREAACRAATKAFLVNGVADVGLGFGVILSFAVFGTLDIQEILGQAQGFAGQSINLLSWAGLELHADPITLIVLFLFVGALGKSAQIPFHVWLPFAMEAPTPVSALIHAATMVNAGPFLLVRLSPLIVLSPAAMTVIAIIGAMTALFGALVSLTQPDIKKLLAYSTISQIGFMMMACGVGAFAAAIFHLLAHGFLKGFLFLSTGNALQDVSEQGHLETSPAEGLSQRRAWALSLGALVLAGFAPFLLFAASYEGVWILNHFPAARLTFWAAGLATVFFTAMYAYRWVISLFREGPVFYELGHPNPRVAYPRLFSPSHVLGFGATAAVLAALLLVLWSGFAQFLAPAVGQSYRAAGDLGQLNFLSQRLMLPLLTAVAGWGLAYMLYRNPSLISVKHSKLAATAYVAFLNKLYFDEIYDRYIVEPTVRFARWLWREVDVQGIDRLINGIAGLSIQFSRWLWQAIDVRGIDRAVDGSAAFSVRVAGWLWRVIDVRGAERTVGRIGKLADDAGHVLQQVEPRTLQHHLLVVVCWLAMAIGLAYWLVL